MDPRSQTLLGSIVSPPCSPSGSPSGVHRESARAFRMSQVVLPDHPCGGQELDIPYSGPERRAQGVLIAEVVEGPEIRPA